MSYLPLFGTVPHKAIQTSRGRNQVATQVALQSTLETLNSNQLQLEILYSLRPGLWHTQ